MPIFAENNQQHVMEFRLVVGQGLDSNSFHTIELKQLQVRKFSQFLTTAGAERAKAQVDTNSFLVARIEQLVELEQFKKWVKT